jgi:hypothetical protein
MQEILHEIWEAAIMRLVKACSWTSIIVRNCLDYPKKLNRRTNHEIPESDLRSSNSCLGA